MAVLRAAGWRGPLRRCLSASSSAGGALERMGYVAPDDLAELCTGELPRRDALFERAMQVRHG